MNQIEKVRTSERNKLVENLTRQLVEDERVVAAWLHGSIGRGKFDVWSDIDVWIVVKDEAFNVLIEDRYEEVTRIGDVVLTEEAPQNSPAGGTYLMAGYDSPTGIHLIDWYWQPLSLARRPGDVFILVEKGCLDQGEAQFAPPHVAWHPSPDDDAANSAALAWAMIAIQAKYIARNPTEKGLGFQGFIEELIEKACGSPYESTIEEFYEATEKLERLEGMARDLTRLVPNSSMPAKSVLQFLSSVRSSIEVS